MSKIDLRDVVFNIPTLIDSIERKDNLLFVVEFLNHHFNTTIFVGEGSESSQLEFLKIGGKNKICNYKHFYMRPDFFHKNKILNCLARETDHPIICTFDADVVCDPDRLVQSVQYIRDNVYDFVSPYDGDCYNLDRNYMDVIRANEMDCTSLGNLGPYKLQHKTPGGVLFLRRKEFFEIGMENEYFMNYGPEDVERLHRMKKLGYRLHRMKGGLLHIKHYRGKYSSQTGSYFVHNERENNRVHRMTKLQLERYVKTWPWTRKDAVSDTPNIRSGLDYKISEEERGKILAMGTNKDTFENTKKRIDEFLKTTGRCCRDIVLYNLGMSGANKNLLSRYHKFVTIVDLPQLNKTIFKNYLQFDQHAWKIYALYDARKFGRHILWIDNNVKILQNLSIFYKIISEEGVLFLKNGNWKVKQLTSKKCLKVMKCSHQESLGPHIMRGVIGYDSGGSFSKLFEDAFKYSKIKDCVHGDNKTHRHEQSVYSILASRYMVDFKTDPAFINCTPKTLTKHNIVAHPS